MGGGLSQNHEDARRRHAEFEKLEVRRGVEMEFKELIVIKQREFEREMRLKQAECADLSRQNIELKERLARREGEIAAVYDKVRQGTRDIDTIVLPPSVREMIAALRDGEPGEPGASKGHGRRARSLDSAEDAPPLGDLVATPQVSGLGTPKALRTKTPGAAGYLPPIGGGGRSSKDFSAVDDELDDVDDDDGPFRAAGTRARPAEVQGASLSDSGARHGAKAGMRSSASDSNLF